MPNIIFDGRLIECELGANLRKVLLREKAPLYNGWAKSLHCRGMGTCGTCAVRITGSVSPPTAVEHWRLGFPPHRRGSGLRLACQCKVEGDLELTKYSGMWGEQIDRPVA